MCVSVCVCLKPVGDPYSHDARYVADRHRPVVGPALPLLVLAAVRVLAGGRVVRHLDGGPAGLFALTQLSQLLGQSRQVLGGTEENRHGGGVKGQKRSPSGTFTSRKR